MTKKEKKYKIIEAIQNGEKYSVIASNFNITKQRVQQIAKNNNLERWKTNRTKYETTIEQINVDYKNGMAYDELITKYNINHEYSARLKYYGLDSLFIRFLKERNNIITNKYKINTAHVVLMDKDLKLNSPNRVANINSIYRISSANGYKKSPNIKCSIDPSVLEIIKARKNSPIKHTNQMIADELNEKGFKTSYGNAFLHHTINNIWNKYKKQGDKKSKIKAANQ